MVTVGSAFQSDPSASKYANRALPALLALSTLLLLCSVGLQAAILIKLNRSAGVTWPVAVESFSMVGDMPVSVENINSTSSLPVTIDEVSTTSSLRVTIDGVRTTDKLPVSIDGITTTDEMPVSISEISTTDELKVNLHNHYIIGADPLPVRIEQ